ncbi:MAG: hypothetical protein IJX48_06990 [Paludibacteraceae bacterium]|nr:hypothetical protein [Paludibacteraceae bacterium]MBQ9143340.1 hypothetical protein [Paludibacteraceae bacterium]
MKKVLSLALFLLGISNAPMFGMVQEIVLTELYSIAPLDDAKEETLGGRPNPTQIRATIDETRMRVSAPAAMSMYVEVINQTTGEVVVEVEFEDETEATINQAGLYIVQIYSVNTVLTGEFEVK